MHGKEEASFTWLLHLAYRKLCEVSKLSISQTNFVT